MTRDPKSENAKRRAKAESKKLSPSWWPWMDQLTREEITAALKTAVERKKYRDESEAERIAFEARPHITRKEFDAIKFPAFVRVKFADAPDQVELIMDKHLDTAYVSYKNGKLGSGGIDNWDQIVKVLYTVPWPELPLTDRLGL